MNNSGEVEEIPGDELGGAPWSCLGKSLWSGSNAGLSRFPELGLLWSSFVVSCDRPSPRVSLASGKTES